MRKPDEAHIQTEKELRAVEKRIAILYRQAAQEMEGQVDAYFGLFEARDAEMKEWLADGRINKRQYDNWRLAQIGRGQRFETIRNNLANRMTQANVIARTYINGEIPKIYVLNYRYTIEYCQNRLGGVLAGIDFALVNEHTIKRLLKEQPSLMPNYPEEKALKRGIDLAYGKRKITENVTKGILQGNSTKKIASDLMHDIKGMSQSSAINAARTAVTEAQNAGRQDASNELSSKGVIMKKTWFCTHDHKTRPEHRDADNQEKDADDFFIVGGERLMYPCDSKHGASGWNIYGCRCTMINKPVGFRSVLTEKQRKKANIRVIKS